jgi:hypothetical protein
MICSSVNRLGFMSIPSEVMDSTHFWRRFWGSGQVWLLQLRIESHFEATTGKAFSSGPETGARADCY